MIKDGNTTESRIVDLDSLSIERVIEELTAASEGLTDVCLTVEHDYSYGDCYVRQYITGWRPATPEEIAADDVQRRRAANQERERQDRLAERLRQERPDLFQ